MKIEIDVARLAYDPNSESFVDDLCRDIPAFRKFYDRRHTEAEAVFTWVVLVYDFNSTTRKGIRDYYHRKAYCANLVGWAVDKSTGKFDPNIESLLLGGDAEINVLVVAYVSSFSSPEYTQLVAFTAMQHQLLMDILGGVADDRISKNMDLITGKISDFTKQLFGSGEKDEVAEARKALYFQAGEDLKKLRPESVVEMLEKDGKLPDEWSPYGEGVQTVIKYVGDDLDIVDND